jgi:hypothetical protein
VPLALSICSIFSVPNDGTGHDDLWNIMRKFNFDTNITEVIKCLTNKTTSAVFLNNEIGQYFKTTVGVKQGCILSPVLFNIFLENIMQETQ